MVATALAPEVRRKLVTRGREDPNWFIRTALGRKQWSMQDRVVESVRDHKTTVVVSGNSLGKTYLASNVVLWFLLNHYPCIVLTTAPTGRQVPALLWKEIGIAHQRAPRPLGGRLLTQELKLAKNWFAMGFTASRHTPDSFAGFHEAHVLVVVDESNGVPESIHDGIDGILASGHARKLEIGNPLDPSSPFARSFRMPSASKFRLGAFDSPNFTEFGITVEDIRSGEWVRKVDGRPLPYPSLVNPEWVREKWEKWCGTRKEGEDDPRWVARVEGRFPSGGPDTMFPWSYISAAKERELAPRETTQKILAVDVARFGDDENVFLLRHGGKCRVVYASEDTKPDLMVTAGRAIVSAREHGASKIYIDSVGVGGGVLDRIRELRPAGIQAEGVVFGGTAMNEDEFYDVRGECYHAVRDMMLQGSIDIDSGDEELESELAGLKRVFKGGRSGVESKDSMRKRGLKSPNRADALAIAFADAFEPEPAQVW
jgi:hypothetical protein